MSRNVMFWRWDRVGNIRKYKMGNKETDRVKEEKNLGVMMQDSLSP